MKRTRHLFSLRSGYSGRQAIDHRLFQASMYRDNALVLAGIKKATSTGTTKAWLEKVLRITREDALRLARANLFMARRLAALAEAPMSTKQQAVEGRSNA